MHGRITSDEIRATTVEAQGGRTRHNRAPNWFSSLVAELWPVKGPAAIAQYAQCPDRTARAYASGDREPSASVLRDLVRGDEGFRVITHIMRGFAPTWWVNIHAAMHMAEDHRALKAKLQGIIDGIQA